MPEYFQNKSPKPLSPGFHSNGEIFIDKTETEQIKQNRWFFLGVEAAENQFEIVQASYS